MRSFRIDTKPYGTHKVYKKKDISIMSGVTVLVGCNGCGKTTLLQYIKQQLESENIPVISFNNLHDGGHNSLGEMLYKENFAMASNMMCSSEGECIILNIGNFAKRIKTFISTGGKSTGNKMDDLLKKLKDEEETEHSASTEYWILFDAVDSGLSIDNVMDIKEYLFKSIIEHCDSLGYIVHIVVSANEYEMCVGQNCFNVQAGKYVDIDSYDDFKKVVLDTREYKYAQEKKYFESVRK